jgi:hypothetical protein
VYFGILVEVAAESEMADAGRASRGHRDHHQGESEPSVRMQYVGLERAEQGEMSDRWERAVIKEIYDARERAENGEITAY